MFIVRISVRLSCMTEHTARNFEESVVENIRDDLVGSAAFDIQRG